MTPAILLKTFIFLVSSLLFFPVLVGLSLLVVWMLFHAGGTLAEWLHRRSLQRPPQEELPRVIARGSWEEMFAAPVLEYGQALKKLLAAPGASEPIVENLLQEFSARLWRSLDRVHLLIRVAPALGLIGTLIPMGSGLASLGQGNMSRLASDLVVAFTTTVVGLAIGISAYFFFSLRRRWVEQDVRTIELLTEIIADRTEENTS